MFITPVQRKENTPARASRARTCKMLWQTAACLPEEVFSLAPGGLVWRGCFSPSTKGCFPSWQKRKAESSGGAFQRVLHQGWPQPSRWSKKRAGSVAGQNVQLSLAHPVSAGSGEPWAWVLAAPTPAVSKGLCSVERWWGSGSE